MNGQPEVLRRNWVAAGVVCTVCAGIALLAVWLTTAPLIRAEAPQRSWGEVILYDAFFILAGIFACWGPMVQVLTRVSSHGVSQLTLLGRKTLAWDEITEVRTGANVLILKSRQAKVRINPFLIGGNSLVQLILERTRKAR